MRLVANTQLTNLSFLTCILSEVAENQEETVAGPLRQTRDMLCAFKPGDGGPEETYTGMFQSIGRDQRGSVDWVMIWDVKGTPSMLGTPGFLQQIYFVDPAAPPGRATPLIGETNSSIVLETLAENQEQTGCGREAINHKRSRCSEIEIDSKLSKSMPSIIRFYADAVLAVAMVTLSVIAAFPAAAGQPNDRRRRDGRSVPSQRWHYLNSRLAADPLWFTMPAECRGSRCDRHLLEAATTGREAPSRIGLPLVHVARLGWQ